MKPSWAVTKFTLASGPRSSAEGVRGSGQTRGEPTDADRGRGTTRVVDVAQARSCAPCPCSDRSTSATPPGSCPSAAAEADVPRLGDELRVGEDRVGGDGGEERMLRRVGVGAVAGDGRGEVEAEPVDLHLLRPVAQGVQHEPGPGVGGRVEGVCRIWWCRCRRRTRPGGSRWRCRCRAGSIEVRRFPLRRCGCRRDVEDHFEAGLSAGSAPCP